ncbi:MAG: hypothetical protein U1F49_10260 [Rubrivivax sp.]
MRDGALELREPCSLGGIRRAWALEGERPRAAGHSRWSWHNTMLQSYAR